MRTKKKTPKEKEGDVKRTTLGLRKRGQQKKPKNTEKPSAPQPRGHFWEGPEIHGKKRHRRAPPAREICARSGHTAKNTLFKTSSVLQPQGFFDLWNPISTKLEHRTVQNSNRRKKLSSRQVRKKKPFRHAKRDRRGTETRNGSKTPCFVAFRVCPLRQMSWQKTADQS